MQIWRVGLIGTVLLAIAFAPAAQVAATQSAPIGTGGATHDLVLSVRLPPGPYFRNELIRVTVEARNVGSRPVPLTRYLCPNGNLYVEVQNGSGRTVYPPAVSGPPVACPAPVGTISLQPSTSLRKRMLIVLRGRYIRAVTFPGTLRSTGYITGPAIKLRLQPGTPPQVITQTQPSELVTIEPANPAQAGLLLYQESSFCSFPDATSGPTGSGTATLRWQRAPIGKDGYTFEPPCQQHVQWHLVAGWVGQPVVSINYLQP